MIVRGLRDGNTYSVCPDHFYGRLAPPPGSPLLGEVLDGRTLDNECEWCAVQACLPSPAEHQLTRAIVELAHSRGQHVTMFRGGGPMKPRAG